MLGRSLLIRRQECYARLDGLTGSGGVDTRMRNRFRGLTVCTDPCSASPTFICALRSQMNHIRGGLPSLRSPENPRR